MTLEEKFAVYHKNNPVVFKLLKKFTKRVKNKGFQHYSIYAIMHQVRWHIDIETDDPEGFKLNNNYAPLYARLLAKKYPILEGFFRNRKLKAEKTLRLL